MNAATELERQIEDTRRSLDRTLHNLQLRLSPRYQGRQALRAVRERTSRSLESGARWAMDKPVPAAFLILGIFGVLYLGSTRFRRRGP